MCDDIASSWNRRVSGSRGVMKCLDRAELKSCVETVGISERYFVITLGRAGAKADRRRRWELSWQCMSDSALRRRSLLYSPPSMCLIFATCVERGRVAAGRRA